jgi:hypothetical protein
LTPSTPLFASSSAVRLAGQAEDRVAHAQDAAGAGARHGVVELGQRVQAVDAALDLVVGGLQSQLEPHIDAAPLLQSLQFVERPVRQGVGSRGERHAAQGRRVLGHGFASRQPRVEAREHLAQALGRDVGVRVALEVRHHGGGHALLGAAGDARQASLHLPSQVEPVLQRARARALDVAVRASSPAARAVAIGAGRTRVERHAMRRAPVAREHPRRQGAEGRRVLAFQAPPS